MPIMQNSYLTYAGLQGNTRGANIIDGAQNGVGVHLPSLDGAMPATWGPLVLKVVNVPTIFRLIDNGEALFVSMIEKHAKAVDGVDFGYQMSFNPHQIGHDKQELQVPTSNARTPIAPNISYDEVNGNLIWNIHRTWLWLIRDPDTQTSGASVLGSDIDTTLLSSIAADLCLIQYDGTGLPENILDAMFITGFIPEETGLAGFKREIGTVETQTRQIPYKGIVQHNARTREAGIDIARTMNLHRANYTRATPIADRVADRISEYGLAAEMSQINNDFV